MHRDFERHMNISATAAKAVELNVADEGEEFELKLAAAWFITMCEDYSPTRDTAVAFRIQAISHASSAAKCGIRALSD